MGSTISGVGPRTFPREVASLFACKSVGLWLKTVEVKWVSHPLISNDGSV